MVGLAWQACWQVGGNIGQVQLSTSHSNFGLLDLFSTLSFSENAILSVF